MLVTNPFRLAVALLRNAALPALTCLALLCGQSADAAPAAKRPASGSHSAALRAKSFGPEATKTAARATVQQLPAHPGGLPHYSVRPSPGDSLSPRQKKSRGESSPKEMPQPIVALRGSTRPTGSGEGTSGNSSPSLPELHQGNDPRTWPPANNWPQARPTLIQTRNPSILPDLPQGADPRTNPSDMLPKKLEIPKLSQRHDADSAAYYPDWSNPEWGRVRVLIERYGRTLSQIEREVDRHVVFTGRGWGMEPTDRLRTLWELSDELSGLIAQWAIGQELEVALRQPFGVGPLYLFRKPNTDGQGNTGQTRPHILRDGAGGITDRGGSHQSSFPLVPNGQQSNEGGSSGRREGANHPGYMAGNHPDHESHGGERGSNQDQNSSGSGPTPPEEHRITSTGPDASSSRQEPSTAKETTKKDNTSDKKTPAEDVKKDPMESQKKQTQQAGLPADDGSRGGNDVGGHRPGRGARDNRGGIQQMLNPELNAVGTTTGADDAERPIVGRGGTTNPSGNAPSLNDLRGRRGNNSGGAQVPGPTEGVWWYLNGTRGQPRQ